MKSQKTERMKPPRKSTHCQDGRIILKLTVKMWTAINWLAI